ncbi:MAG: lipase family protein, partial [Terracidiphilus sp.]
QKSLPFKFPGRFRFGTIASLNRGIKQRGTLLSHYDLALLCQQSYSTVPGATPIAAADQQAWILHHTGASSVVVFRGTDNLGDVLKDLDCRPRETWLPGRLHAGFYCSWIDLRTQILAEIQCRKVIFTGHSLGGALATIAAADLGDFGGRPRSETCSVEEVVTFGSPRVGNSAFVADYKNRNIKTTRYVNQDDPVPWVPGLLLGYRHVCPATWWDGRQWRNLSLLDWMKSLYQACRTDPLSLIEDHEMRHYIAAYKAGQPADLVPVIALATS